ncbi:hypothetical protein V474_21495 [Novosphingobium barchaimii LL02]|uniref:Uncharacterized protein n=1 Tax=Novosphingobium barchaimii LL02 TaxID=1114963 RepID=A0A0J7XS15_9SPHN|nr:hypothetical protein V474_21495 [Novosphingobium barchaimii LL02]
MPVGGKDLPVGEWRREDAGGFDKLSLSGIERMVLSVKVPETGSG